MREIWGGSLPHSYDVLRGGGFVGSTIFDGPVHHQASRIMGIR